MQASKYNCEWTLACDTAHQICNTHMQADKRCALISKMEYYKFLIDSFLHKVIFEFFKIKHTQQNNFQTQNITF